MRIAVISDTHISEQVPELLHNLDAVAEWVRQLRPDLLLHLGDGVAHGIHDPTQYDLLRNRLASIPCAIRWVPGNHDIGENHATAALSTEHPVQPRALAEWRRRFGADYWSIVIRDWQLIGLNALLFEGDDGDDLAQWQWLQNQLSDGVGKLGLVLHKPLFRDRPGGGERHPRYLPPESGARLWASLKRRDVRFVLSGHTHQFRRAHLDGIELVWAPSCAYRIDDRLQERIGQKVVGTLTLELTSAGHSFTLVEPAGIVQHDIVDHLDLYPELEARLGRPRSRPPP